MELCQPSECQIDEIATIWHQGWVEAHAAHLPDSIVCARTLDSFRQRCRLDLKDIRIAQVAADIIGFHMIKQNELSQLFVRREQQGAGTAAAILADAEKRLGASGVEVGQLDCVIGNERAARFYQNHGWRRKDGNARVTLQLPSGSFEVEVWRYEKRLAP